MESKTAANIWRLWLKRILLPVCAYGCVFAWGKVLALQEEVYSFHAGNYLEYNIGSVLLFGVVLWLLNRFWVRADRRLFFYSAFGGLLLSCAVVYGTYAHFVNDIFRSAKESLLQIGLVLGISALTIPAVSELYCALEKANNWMNRKRAEQEGEKESRAGNKVLRYIYAHPAVYFLTVWMLIFISYVPLFLAWWPGNFIFDSKYQLTNVVENAYTTHHPLIHTLMLGNAYKLGQAVGDVSWGSQFYTLTQMLILTSAFAYLILYLYRKRAPRCVRIGVLLWFALFPMHALFSITATKDVLCAAFFLYFMVYAARLVYDREQFRWYSYCGMVVSGVFLALFRNNTIYAIVLAGILIAVFIKGWREKGRILILCLAVYLLSHAANEGLIAYTDASSPTTYRETLSAPLQCMARVACYRRADLPQELYDEICVYIRESDIAGYNPYISDPVKDNANEQWLKNNVLNFFKLWAKIGLQFPDEYVENMITNTMVYWYPLNHGFYLISDVPLFHQAIGVGEEIVKQNYCPWAYEIYADLFWQGNYKYVPLLGFFFRSMPYVWLILFYALWGLYKKDRRGILVWLFPACYLLTCFFAPTAALRYIYCLVVCAPLLIYLAIARRKIHQD